VKNLKLGILDRSAIGTSSTSVCSPRRVINHGLDTPKEIDNTRYSQVIVNVILAFFICRDARADDSVDMEYLAF
jgi:hypothetical protein